MSTKPDYFNIFFKVWTISLVVFVAVLSAAYIYLPILTAWQYVLFITVPYVSWLVYNHWLVKHYQRLDKESK